MALVSQLNATILEFSSVRNLLDGAALSTAGFADVAHWRLHGVPGDTYEVRGLIAEPGLVAVSRTQGLCIVHFLTGTGRNLTAEGRLTAQLNAAVCADVVLVGRSGLQVTIRWIFEDNEHHSDSVYAPEDLAAMLASARQRMCENGWDRARTQDVVRAMHCR
jgi:hypothetical protein